MMVEADIPPLARVIVGVGLTLTNDPVQLPGFNTAFGEDDATGGLIVLVLLASARDAVGTALHPAIRRTASDGAAWRIPSQRGC